MKSFIGILCRNYNNSIGYYNTKKLVFNISDELKNFRKLTSETEFNKKNILLMGRNTWQSLPKPILPGRVSCVITTNYLEYSKLYKNDDINFFGSIPEFLSFFKNNSYQYNNVFIIGGSSIYEYFYKNRLFDFIYLTQITTPNNFGDVIVDLKDIETDYECLHIERFKNIKSIHTNDETTYLLDYNFIVYRNNNKREISFS